QFENELVRMWNKPKFVIDSNYVITKDRIIDKPGGEKIIKLFCESEGIKRQINEWNELGIIGKDFEVANILEDEFKYLPFDTKHFKEIEKQLLSLFDDIDNELNGHLINSENYQALKTISGK